MSFPVEKKNVCRARTNGIFQEPSKKDWYGVAEREADKDL